MSKGKTKVYLSLILLITAIIYIPALFGDFIFDDFNNIVYNYRDLIKDLSPVSIMQTITCTTGGVRPFAHLSFGLNYYFFGINPFYFHFVNLIIHLINTVLVYVLAKKIFARLSEESEENLELAAVLSSLFFAIATIQTSAVSYIVQRMTLGMTMFSLLSFIFFLRKKYLYSVLSFLLALGFKQNAVLILPIIAYFVWIEKGKDKKAFVKGVAVLLFIFILALSPYGLGLWETIQKGYQAKGFTLTERLLTEPRVVFHYISLVIFPYFKRFVLNYHFPLSTSLFSPLTTFFSIAGIVSAIVYSVKSENKILSFFTGFFLIALSLESSFWPLDIAYEHRMYFPMLGIAGIFGFYAAKSKGKVIKTLLVIFLIFNAANTCLRNIQYKDYQTLLLQDLTRYPNNPLALYNMFSTKIQDGKKKEAVKYLEKSVKLNPRFYKIYTSYADYLASEKGIDYAIDYLKKQYKENEKIDKPHLLMWKIANLYQKKGDKKSALKWFSEAMKKNAKSIKIRRDFGLFLFNNGNYYYGYLNMAKAYELDNYKPLTVYYLAKMTKVLKMKEKFEFFSNFYKTLYQEGKYYNLPKPEF